MVAEPARVRRLIGYVGQGNGAGHTQRAADELRTQGVIYGLDRRQARTRTGDLLEALDLTELRDRKVSTLSGGQRRRLDVAMGLVHAPSLLFLDEPSTGLDPHNRANLWEHIIRMRDEHDMTIMLTTHYLDEADSMAGRVVVVDHGQIIADDTADALKADLAGDRIVLESGASAALAEMAARLPGARDVVVDGRQVSARVAHAPTALPELLRAAFVADVEVASTQMFRPTLDDVFLSLTGRSLREAENGQPADTAESSTRKDAA